jgi:hypothetical protein
LFGPVSFCPYCGSKLAAATSMNSATPPLRADRNASDQARAAAAVATPMAAAPALPVNPEPVPPAPPRFQARPPAREPNPTPTPASPRTSPLAEPRKPLPPMVFPVPPQAPTQAPVLAASKRPVFAIVALVLLALALGLGYSFFKRRDKTAAIDPVPAPVQLPSQKPAQVPTKVQPNAQQPTPEQGRDADLKAAKACEQAKDWPCAIRMAERVLAADSGNQEAKALQRRVTLIQLGIEKPPESAQAETSAAPAECGASVRAGKAALKARRYDEAVAKANAALSALALCPEAEQLKQDALLAKQKSNR